MEEYHSEAISRMYQQDLVEHVTDMRELASHLKDVAGFFRENYEKAQSKLEDKLEANEKTKDVIYQAVAG